MSYLKILERAVKTSRSLLCVGLDPNLDLLPNELQSGIKSTEERVLTFCLEVIDATVESCAAYKPNLAFFEALGPSGMDLFDDILKQIPPDKVVIADAKRGDIDSTAEHYKRAFFDHYNTDAVTLNPLMGMDTLTPFLQDSKRAVYALVLTSNPGSQDLLLRPIEGYRSISEYLAYRLRQESKKSDTHIGMVIGATHSQGVKEVLDAYPEASLLIPGIGSQGGRVDLLAGLLKEHRGVPVISSSRSIIYAGSNRSDWKSAVAKKAEETRKELESITIRYL